MVLDSDNSESNLVIITNKDRLKRFLSTYKKAILLIITPLILMPIAFIGQNNAYKSLYIFLVSATVFAGGFLHPGVTSFLPIVLSTTMGLFDWKLINTINLSNSVVHCLCTMAVVLAVEHSNVHKRLAIKILLIFGCSHFRLSFLLFVSSAVLSMWLGDTQACGLMMPLVKATLKELEKMGILETHEIVGQHTAADNEKYAPRPSDFTVFYFIGIAYSATIGGMATSIGSETNQLYLSFCTAKFQKGPKLESPHFLILTLPGVIVLEMFLYLWLNFYFLGMLRVQNYTALQASLSSEEEQFISVLLADQYRQLKKITFHELVVCSAVVLAAILRVVIFSCKHHCESDELLTMRCTVTSLPCIIICVFILFVTPTDLNCLKFFTRRNDSSEPLPTSASGGCLTWTMVKNNIEWSVVFLTASANITFDSLEDSKMTVEFEKFLSLVSNCAAPAQVCVVILLCKILTEFASNATVARCLLPCVANVAVRSKVSPLYLMLSATLSTCLPFHSLTGTPPYAMVSAYVNMPHTKLMLAGVGPSVMAILVNLVTVNVWSRVVWPDIDTYWTNVGTNKSVVAIL